MLTNLFPDSQEIQHNSCLLSVTYLTQVLDLFAASDEVKQNPKLLDDIYIVMTEYCLPSQRSPQPLERAKATVLLTLYSLFFRTLNKMPENIDLDKKHQRYKVTIRIFRKWCKQQSWYSAIENSYPNKRCDCFSGGNYTKHCIDKPHNQAKGRYSLKRADWCFSLQKEVDGLHQWLITPEVKGRPTNVIRHQTWHNQEKELMYFFGWLTNI
ncbi:hypothetical protein [Spirulina major]|uniref:hypothetical protein n=1 Tax=Spirulina major TaxID=270636 RepID=UPI000933627F|nr:hypothetical protein [Spirulina major]